MQAGPDHRAMPDTKKKHSNGSHGYSRMRTRRTSFPSAGERLRVRGHSRGVGETLTSNCQAIRNALRRSEVATIMTTTV